PPWNRDVFCHFFFQAEDGIRDATVTGVQTCALPISANSEFQPSSQAGRLMMAGIPNSLHNLRHSKRDNVAKGAWRNPGCSRRYQIGRASCRESEEMAAVTGEHRQVHREQIE